MKTPSNNVANAFSAEAAQHYDEKNRKLFPISNCLHLLMSLALRNLPANSRILCVGAGTGAEILSLAQAFPGWSFVALDPSQGMLDVCRERMKTAGFEDRCSFVQGYVQDLPEQADFDVVMSILVGHFVKSEERQAFYKGMTKRLKAGGFFFNAEISFDLDSKEFPSMLKSWEGVQEMMGANSESLAALPKLMREVLTVLPPSAVEDLIRQSGIQIPVRFFQAFMIHGWYGTKNS